MKFSLFLTLLGPYPAVYHTLRWKTITNRIQDIIIEITANSVVVHITKTLIL